jgi:hypothetical protein
MRIQTIRSWSQRVPVRVQAGNVPLESADTSACVTLIDSAYVCDSDEDGLRWRILSLIRENEGIRISDVAARLGLELPHAVEVVREMRARGYIGAA